MLYQGGGRHFLVPVSEPPGALMSCISGIFRKFTVFEHMVRLQGGGCPFLVLIVTTVVLCDKDRSSYLQEPKRHPPP